MPPKKKAIKTDGITEETDETLKQEHSNEEDQSIQKPKPKRQLTQKQKDNFVKLQEANKVRYEAKRKAKEDNVNNKIQEVEIKKEEDKSTPKPVEEKEEEEEEEKVIVKPVKKKKKKQKIIIEEDSSSDSENEIIIRRSRGKSKKQKEQLTGYTNDLKLKEKEEEEKKEIKEEKEEPIELNKRYSAVQILRGIGL